MLAVLITIRIANSLVRTSGKIPRTVYNILLQFQRPNYLRTLKEN